MSTKSATLPLNCQLTGEIRAEIVAHVGIESDRYGADSGRCLTKAHVRAVADELDCGSEDLTLEELYWKVCRRVDVEYNSSAGCQWGLGREQLKTICRELRGDDSTLSTEVNTE